MADRRPDEWWTPGGTPVTLPDAEGRVNAVRSAAFCLVHDGWSILAWDGRRLGPRCCLEGPSP